MSRFEFRVAPQFYGRVERGEKRQLIVRKRAKPPRPGDQVKIIDADDDVLYTARIFEVLPIEVEFESGHISLGARHLLFSDSAEFSRLEGFNSRPEMIRWMRLEYGGKGFEGHVIRWRDKADAA